MGAPVATVMSRRHFRLPTIRTERETTSECAPHSKVLATGWSASRVHRPGPLKGISAAGVASVRRPPTLGAPTLVATLVAVELEDEGEAEVVRVVEVVVAVVRDVTAATGVARGVAPGAVVVVVVVEVEVEVEVEVVDVVGVAEEVVDRVARVDDLGVGWVRTLVGVLGSRGAVDARPVDDAPGFVVSFVVGVVVGEVSCVTGCELRLKTSTRSNRGLDHISR